MCDIELIAQSDASFLVPTCLLDGFRKKETSCDLFNNALHVRPCTLYSIVDKSYDKLKLSPTRNNKNFDNSISSTYQQKDYINYPDKLPRLQEWPRWASQTARGGLKWVYRISELTVMAWRLEVFVTKCNCWVFEGLGKRAARIWYAVLKGVTSVLGIQDSNQTYQMYCYQIILN